MTHIPVLVVGGGPVGLATAIGLRLAGVECIVVEKHPTTLDFPKGRGISVRSMEVFRSWGVADQLVAQGLPRGESLFAFVGDSLLGEEFQRLAAPPGTAPPSPEDRLICDQIAMEQVLRSRAVELGADIRFGNRLSGVTQDDERVVAELVDSSGTPTLLSADWMVAADGGRSFVRATLGITRSGVGTVSHAVSVLFVADTADRLAGRSATIYRIGAVPGGALLAVDNVRRWLLIYAYDPAVDGPQTLTPQRCLALARTAIGDDSVHVEVIGSRFWESAVLVSDRYRTGRVLLAGDAAHVVTPIGGLGMNCGIADAHNLAWKLGGVVQGWADASLLDTYDQERRPVAVVTGEASLGAARPPAPTKGVDLGYCYTSSAVVPDGTPELNVEDPVADFIPSGRPGSRAPHVWLDDSRARSTLDLFGSGFVLLTDAAGEQRAQLAASACADTGIPLRVHVREDWQQEYDVQPGAAVLVRPDGHVAWRCSTPLPADTQQLRQDLLQIVGR